MLPQATMNMLETNENSPSKEREDIEMNQNGNFRTEKLQ